MQRDYLMEHQECRLSNVLRTAGQASQPFKEESALLIKRKRTVPSGREKAGLFASKSLHPRALNSTKEN